MEIISLNLILLSFAQSQWPLLFSFYTCFSVSISMCWYIHFLWMQLLLRVINREYVYSVVVYQKVSNEVGRIDNFLALARKLSFLPTELDIFDIQQHYVRILFIFQHLNFWAFLNLTSTNMNLALYGNWLAVLMTSCLVHHKMWCLPERIHSCSKNICGISFFCSKNIHCIYKKKIMGDIAWVFA